MKPEHIVSAVGIRTYERAERIVESEVEGERLERFEHGRVFELDRVRGNVLLHAVLAGLCANRKASRTPAGCVGRIDQRTSLQFHHRRALAGRREGRRRLVRLARRPVERHHPEVGLGLVVAREHHAVALLHRVEEEPAALQVCMQSDRPFECARRWEAPRSRSNLLARRDAMRREAANNALPIPTIKLAAKSRVRGSTSRGVCKKSAISQAYTTIRNARLRRMHYAKRGRGWMRALERVETHLCTATIFLPSPSLSLGFTACLVLMTRNEAPAFGATPRSTDNRKKNGTGPMQSTPRGGSRRRSIAARRGIAGGKFRPASA